ncbi:zinc finger, CCHC-type containing protein [Tanacetum coccineum]
MAISPIPIEAQDRTVEEYWNLILSTLHFLKFPKNSVEVLKLLENSVEVLKILENKLESDSILWHARLELSDLHVNKITKKPFQNVKHETKVLELIHSDLCDLHATPSLGNKKDEALDKFKVFKTEVELKQGSLIKRFRTDRGCEYMNNLYFQSVGIIYEITAPYTPQQNGISERKNGVLKEMVNSMLSYSSLSQGFWVTDEIVHQYEPELRKSKRHRTPKDFRPEFQLYLIEDTRDEVSDQHSYCFNIEDDPKTFDEAIKSQDVAFWKEAINDEMDSIMGNNTRVLTDLTPGYTDVSWISNTEVNSSASGWVFLLSGGIISWAFKKQTCITGFYKLESEFVSSGSCLLSRRVNKDEPSRLRCWGFASPPGSGPLGLKTIMNWKRTHGYGFVHTGIWEWRYRVYTQRSLNTLTQIVVKGILVVDELQLPSESNPSEEVSSAG